MFLNAVSEILSEFKFLSTLAINITLRYAVPINIPSTGKLAESALTYGDL